LETELFWWTAQKNEGFGDTAHAAGTEVASNAVLWIVTGGDNVAGGRDATEEDGQISIRECKDKSSKSLVMICEVLDA
jgi:hypothetical protein